MRPDEQFTPLLQTGLGWVSFGFCFDFLPLLISGKFKLRAKDVDHPFFAGLFKDYQSEASLTHIRWQHDQHPFVPSKRELFVYGFPPRASVTGVPGRSSMTVISTYARIGVGDSIT